MKSKQPGIGGTVLMAAVLTLISCATNPVTGRPEFMLLSEVEEAELGRQTDITVVEQYGLWTDQSLAEYVSSVGAMLDRYSHRPNLPYSYRVMDSQVINAFAVPGGYVYVTRGILAYLNSEAELAGVLGHEIGHVAARHSAQQYSRTQVAQAALGVGTALSENFRKHGGFAARGLQMLFLKHSRDDERQSDDLGVEYATRAGFDASLVADFFVTLDRLRPLDGNSGLPSWMSTHPEPTRRISPIREEAAMWRSRVGSGDPRIGRDDYLGKINGLVFGADPREGYVEGGVFYHPQLRFQLPVPERWRVSNGKTQLTLVEPEGQAAILLFVASEATANEAADNFVNGARAHVATRQASVVGGYAAVRVHSFIVTGQGNLSVLSYFIQKEQSVYALHGVTSQELEGQYQPSLDTDLTRFTQLNDRTRLNVAPSRLTVRRTQRAGSVEGALLSAGVGRDDLERHAVLNGLQLTDRIEAGVLFKVVEAGRPPVSW